MKFKSINSILIAPLVLLFLCTGCGFDCDPSAPIMRELPPNLNAYLDDALFDYDTWLFTSDAGDTMLLKRGTAYEEEIQKFPQPGCRKEVYSGGRYIGFASFIRQYNRDTTNNMSQEDSVKLRVANHDLNDQPITVSSPFLGLTWSYASDSIGVVNSHSKIKEYFSTYDTTYENVLHPVKDMLAGKVVISKESGIIAAYSLDGKRILTLKMKQ